MPRQARRKSGSGIYHVMLRGINREPIFFDEDDNRTFIALLRRYKEVSGFELYAYCLMGNHVHLLLRERDEPLELIFRRFGAAFAYRYNIKYRRTGHIFQDRFKSEPVEDDAYFLTALRYILNNPVKAGLCTDPEEYPYSSAKEYMDMKSDMTDISFAVFITGQKELLRYLHEPTEEFCMDMDDSPRRGMSDQEALALIHKQSVELHRESDDADALAQTVAELIGAGISIRQMERLSGLSKAQIEKCLRKNKTGDGSLS